MIRQQVIDEVTRRLVQTYKPIAVYLFGSYAWGTPREDSDLDLMVVVDSSEQSYFKRSISGSRALWGLEIFKDLLVYTENEFKCEAADTTSLCHKIEHDAVKLYVRA